MKTVIIASKNPVKIEAVKIAFEKMFLQEKFEFIGESIPSDVNAQPMSNEETLQGAMNRAINAQSKFPEANFWVGLEGGLEKTDNDFEKNMAEGLIGLTVGIMAVGFFGPYFEFRTLMFYYWTVVGVVAVFYVKN